MIQFLVDNVDQLDLALDQLAVRDRNFDRFALMLIDNVLELTLHQYGQSKASENESWVRLGKPRHDPSLIQKAISQNFDSKAKSSTKLGLFDVTTCESILNLHTYRNTAYHKGLRHEKILHSLAIFYFKITCHVLSNYELQSWSSGNNIISHRAVKYLGTNVGYRITPEMLKNAFIRLDQVASTLDSDLVGDLTLEMQRTIQQTDDDIAFINKNSPVALSRNDVVLDSQSWSKAFTEEGKAFAATNGYTIGAIKDFVDWLSINYPWQVKADPVPNWKSRLASLSSEQNPHAALKKYCDFMRQTDEVRTIISDSSMHLDEYIQQQVDIMLGK